MDGIVEKYKQLAEILKKKIVTNQYSQRPRFPSEKELADLYGLSVQTVNKAVSILLSENVLVRVKGSGVSIAENSDLKKIRNNCLFRVGILIDSSAVSISAADRVLARIAFNIQHQLTQNGILWTIISRSQGMNYHEYFAKHDGLIIIGDSNALELQEITRYEIPCVAFNRDYLSAGVSSVFTDDEGIRSLVKYLHDAGCKKFLYVIDDYGLGIYDIREDQYRRSVQQIGGSVETVVIPGLSESARTIPPDALKKIQNADAAFSPNDKIAIAFMQSLETAGVSVPGDLAVCGFDNTTAGQCFHVPLSTITYDIFKTCSAIVDLMSEVLFSRKAPRMYSIQSQLILRKSTEVKKETV